MRYRAGVADDWSIRRVLDWTAKDFRERGLGSPRLDAELIVGDALSLNRVGLYLELDRPLSDEELVAIRDRVKRRRGREPVAYIVGHREFWGRRFDVSPAVLVPRPDTETLVQRALDLVPKPPKRRFLPPEPEPEPERGPAAEGESAEDIPAPPEMAIEPPPEALEAPPELAEPPLDPAMKPREARILDLCTGSGCIGLTLAAERPHVRVDLTDASAEALAVARQNAERHALGDRARFLEGDLFAPVGDAAYHLIVCNPPYVTEAELAECDPEVRDHEPRMALVPGPGGLELIERLVAEAGAHLERGGTLLIEVGADQARRVETLAAAQPWCAETRVHEDLGGIERVVEARRG